jgi:geranylgeranyl diphosphate synthase type II
MSKTDLIPSMQEALEMEANAMPFGKEPFELYEPIRYSMRMGGKRMRPLLTLLSYQLYRQDWEAIIRPALAVEVFHNFTLLHDDIMDKAPLRRGQPTVYKKWNETVAILSGDVMLVKAYDLLLEMPPELLPEILRKFNQTAAEVCEGQQWDMNFEEESTVTIPMYMDMIRLKTAVLLGFSMWLGGKLAGRPQDTCDTLYAIGENMGIGFQLMDDYLDVYAEKAKFGKQVGGDIIANKKTFLLLQAMQNARGEQLEELQVWLSTKNFDAAKKVNAITSIYGSLGIPELTKDKMNHYYNIGFNLIEQLDLPEKQALGLKSFFENLTQREK